MSGHAWSDHPDLVAYYAEHRCRPEDLYPSERHYLPELAATSASVLDVGCGAGGFLDIWRAFNADIAYTGVDTSAPLIAEARRRHPDVRFVHADAVDGLPFEDRGADTVAALGWLHWEPRWEAALSELWRVTRERLFFDVRLLEHETVAGEQRLALTGEWDGHTTVPYLCVGWPALSQALHGLGAGAVRGHGYPGPPAATVVGVPETICFATFVIERRAQGEDFAVELPFEVTP
jgi:SAM-dependent methyltransferase